METWYFTFGCGQKNEGCCQPIVAEDFNSAREKMIRLYSTEWCMQYSEKEWEEMKNDPKRFWPMERELKVI